MTENQNPSLNIEKNKEKPRQRYITDFELHDFLKDADPIFKNEIDFIYRTALRLEDSLNFEFDDLVTHINKTKTKLHFLHSNELTKTLKMLRTQHDKKTVFYHTESQFRKLFYKLREKTGIIFTIHDIRAKSISDYAEIYGQEEARKFASHANIQTTLGYIRNRKGVTVKTL